MRRGPKRQDRPPRVGAAVLAKALLGVFLIFASTGAGVAVAGYLMIDNIVPPPKPGEPEAPPLPEDVVVEPPEPGGPRTIMVLGSDRRSKRSTDAQLGQKPHSDTIVLIRLDPKRNRIAVLSLPRDLAVTIPGYADGVKINEAYTEGGPGLTLKTVKHLFESSTSHTFPINSVIDVNFLGFQEAVNHVKGVYVDVDRKYYVPEGSGFAAIDVPAGYQRLVGSDALAYVRFRHNDSDLYRNVRQQDFLRQASGQRSVRELRSLDDAGELLGEFQQYFRFDRKFKTTKNIAGLLKTGLYLALNKAPVNQIQFRGVTESENPTVDTRLYASAGQLRQTVREFMNARASSKPVQTAEPTAEDEESARIRKKRNRNRQADVAGLEESRAQGVDQAVLADPKLKFPFYFPTLRTSGAGYAGTKPRIYDIRDEQGKKHEAYRLVLSKGLAGEYYGVQGTTWKDPPILDSPDQVRTINGRKLRLYHDGRRLRLVAWKTRRAVYWVSNTLSQSLNRRQMLAIADSLRRLKQ